MSTNFMTTVPWSNRLLCRKYAIVRFDRSHVANALAAERPALTCTWAIGVTSRLEVDVLGWWLHCPSHPRSLEAILEELRARGFEQAQAILDDNRCVDGTSEQPWTPSLSDPHSMPSATVIAGRTTHCSSANAIEVVSVRQSHLEPAVACDKDAVHVT